MPFLAAIDYSVFPPINASLNSLSAALLITGVVLIKAGRREAHQRVMVGALVSSALFLGCYLFYHYGVGHTEFPRDYPVARRIYLAILIPHVILAMVNLPFIIALVVAAFRGSFERHKRLARWVFPSWLFVSVTGVVIYFMIYHWFPPPEASAASAASAAGAASAPAGEETVIEEERRLGDLVFRPGFRAVPVEPGENVVRVAIQVENAGDAEVEITSLTSGCDCLEVSIDRNPVPAGGGAEITGVFDTTRLSGTSEQRIAVRTSAAERPLILLTRIEIQPVYILETPLVQWELGSEPETRTVAFRVKREEPVRVLRAESLRGEVECEVVEIEEGRAYDLRLTPRSTDSALLGVVRIETDCEIDRYARALAYFAIQ